MVVGSLDISLARCSLLVCWNAWQTHIFANGACSSIHEDISSHASFVHPLVNLSFSMCSLHSCHFSSHHVCWCTCTCSHSWQNDIKSKNLLVYHDTWSFRIQVIGRGNKLARQGDGSEKCWWKLHKGHWVMKMQNPRRQWLSRRSNLGGRKNYANFGRVSSGCRRDGRKNLCIFQNEQEAGDW